MAGLGLPDDRRKHAQDVRRLKRYLVLVNQGTSRSKTSADFDVSRLDARQNVIYDCRRPKPTVGDINSFHHLHGANFPPGGVAALARYAVSRRAARLPGRKIRVHEMGRCPRPLVLHDLLGYFHSQERTDVFNMIANGHNRGARKQKPHGDVVAGGDERPRVAAG